MSRSLRTAANLAAGSVLVGTALLGAVWLRDRAHRREPPRWESGTFVPLQAGSGPEWGRPPRWVVPVNLGCRHCFAALSRLHDAWARGSRSEALAALVVDSPVRPAAAAVQALPRVPVWWDRDGVWRRRWGHRLYGELIEFDATGRHIRTVGPGEALRSGGRPLLAPMEAGPTPDAIPAPTSTTAPATREGGTSR